MNSKIATMGLFAVLMVAAFAGIALVADEGYATSVVGGDSNPEQTDGADTQGSGEGEDGQSSVTTSTGYTVTYKLDEYTYTTPATTKAISLPSLTDLGVTVKAGSTFVGWYLVEDGKTNTTAIYAVGSTYIPTKNTTFEAYVITDYYAVSFAYADGTVIKAYTAADTLEYNDDLTLPTKATSVGANLVLTFREVDGQIFAGWALKDTPETVVIAASEETVKVVGNVDYVAVYVHDPILTFIVDGTLTYKHTEYGAVLPIAPSKEGFTFVGWNDGTQTILDGDLAAYVADLKADVILNAVWEPAVYTVAFVVDGETVLTQSVKHGETATEPKIIPAKDGSSFVAWTVDDKTYDFASPVTGDLTVTASFEAVPAPAPTGLKNPMTQMLLIIIGTLVLALIAVMLWKRDVIRAGLVKRLDKGDKGNGGDSA